MENIEHAGGLAKAEIIRYAWPTPLGFLMILAGYGVFYFVGERAFLVTHVWFELAAIIPMVASFIYAFRLGRRWRSPIFRWVFVLNLCFGPLLLLISVINLLIHAISAIA
jgi:hypothetical protein